MYIVIGRVDRRCGSAGANEGDIPRFSRMYIGSTGTGRAEMFAVASGPMAAASIVHAFWLFEIQVMYLGYELTRVPRRHCEGAHPAVACKTGLILEAVD
jgi:hypothetical protein